MSFECDGNTTVMFVITVHSIMTRKQSIKVVRTIKALYKLNELTGHYLPSTEQQTLSLSSEHSH